MKSRERILKALKHKETDRIPIDLGSTESSGITAIAYNRLKKHLNIVGPTRIFDISQMIAKVELPVIEKVGSDAVPLLLEPKVWKPWQLQDGSSAEIPAGLEIKSLPDGGLVILDNNGDITMRCPTGSMFFDCVSHPLRNAETLTDIDAGEKYFKTFDWPDYANETFDDLSKKARLLYENTSFAIVANLWVHVFAAAQAMRGFENFLMDMVLNESMANRLLENQVEAYLPRIDKYIQAVGEYVDVIQVNDDLGTQNGPQISAELYRKIVKPHHKRLWEYIKKKSKKPLLLHSCGSVYEFIPDFIEMGIDALNPVQVSAAKMDTRLLKRQFGKDLTFWGGGCDTQTVLCHGTVDDVRQEVRRRVNDLAPGGGFVFCQVHNIQPDVPPENIMAMYEELRSY